MMRKIWLLGLFFVPLLLSCFNKQPKEKIETINEYRVEITFTDNTTKVMDFKCVHYNWNKDDASIFADFHAPPDIKNSNFRIDWDTKVSDVRYFTILKKDKELIKHD